MEEAVSLDDGADVCGHGVGFDEHCEDCEDELAAEDAVAREDAREEVLRGKV